ncbi:MAG: hypothetical protein HY271_02705 [Deltaproteobacteria bacterium]|nr:hypothetical protein [Deltaproteobacteria bacterium]
MTKSGIVSSSGAAMRRGYTDMAHEFESAPALEMLVTRLGEMEVVLGASAAVRLGAVRAHLQRAVALRADGALPDAAAAIRRAMEELATLVSDVDPREGVLMRAVVERFNAALLRAEPTELERTADLMRERSGAIKVPKKP